MTAAKPTLTEALVAAQGEMPKVEPDAENPHFRSKFVSLGHLIATTRPTLVKHGLAIRQSPTHIDGQPALETTIHHGPSGESVSSVMPLLVGKNDMQGLGSAITYARRYAWSAALCISDEDDDGNQASQESGSATPAGAGGGANESAAPSPPTDAEIEALFVLAEERGGDPDKTKTGYATAVKQNKVAAWYATAKKHYESQPVMSNFGKQAADAQVAGEKARAEREAKAAADRKQEAA